MTEQRFRAYNAQSFRKSKYWDLLDEHQQETLTVISEVLPFKVNEYVLETLIDWTNIPNDPIFQLTFPQPGMIPVDEFQRIKSDLSYGADGAVSTTVSTLRRSMNPHPAGQKTMNVPLLNGREVPGVQHKYRETVLFFPSAGQSCHAYCTFCFRWAQFIGDKELKFAARNTDELKSYLADNPAVTDVLITGGDPMVMATKHIEQIFDALSNCQTIRNVRLGTKSLAYWPQRFTSDPDSDELIRLFERTISAGVHISVMAHINHPIEISTPEAQAAIKRILETGAQIRLQAPVIRHINDDAAVWTELLQESTRLGITPYYMFVERNTGPADYFRLPLVRAFDIYREAMANVSGLARTLRGPSMSTTHGKVVVDGIREVNGQRVFILRLLQARDTSQLFTPFFAKFDADATWLDQLEPAEFETFWPGQDHKSAITVVESAKMIEQISPALAL